MNRRIFLIVVSDMIWQTLREGEGITSSMPVKLLKIAADLWRATQTGLWYHQMANVCKGIFCSTCS